MINKHIKSCSASLVINKVQIKTLIRCYYLVTSMTKLKDLQIPSGDKLQNKLELPYAASEDVK